MKTASFFIANICNAHKHLCFNDAFVVSIGSSGEQYQNSFNFIKYCLLQYKTPHNAFCVWRKRQKEPIIYEKGKYTCLCVDCENFYLRSRIMQKLMEE